MRCKPIADTRRHGFLIAALTLLGAVAPARAEPPNRTCVDVTIGTERYYDCLNQAIARQVPEDRRSAAESAPYSATSPSPQVGAFNHAATAEHMGNALGHSAIPQRPPTSVFPNPLVSTLGSSAHH